MWKLQKAMIYRRHRKKQTARSASKEAEETLRHSYVGRGKGRPGDTQLSKKLLRDGVSGAERGQRRAWNRLPLMNFQDASQTKSKINCSKSTKFFLLVES